jgi:glutaredoxin-related protein
MVVLYSTNCPKCKVLKSKLEKLNIDYVEVTDIKELIDKGFKEAPQLEVDGEFMNFSQANVWLRERDSNAN